MSKALIKKMADAAASQDQHWNEVMELAKNNGFITVAGGGTAVLITHTNQLQEYGAAEYMRIQRMNGRCPRLMGLSCIDKETNQPYCTPSCELRLSGKVDFKEESGTKFKREDDCK